jgi:hypothetical protein
MNRPQPASNIVSLKDRRKAQIPELKYEDICSLIKAKNLIDGVHKKMIRINEMRERMDEKCEKNQEIEKHLYNSLYRLFEGTIAAYELYQDSDNGEAS